MFDPLSDRALQLRAAITTRLERVRGGLTDAEFHTLVSAVLNTRLRFDEIESREQEHPTPLRAAPRKPS